MIRTKLIAVALSLTATTAWCQTSVQGDVRATGSARSVVAAAIGADTAAEIAAGSALGGDVDGNLELSGRAGSLTAVAIGYGPRAAIYVGSRVGGDLHGDVEAHGSARSITVVSMVPGDTSCVAVGSVRGRGQGGASVSARVGHVVVVDFIPWLKSRVNVGTVGRPC